jgi:hypothetical protein
LYSVFYSKRYYSTANLTNTVLVSQTTGIIVGLNNTATLQATLWGDGPWGNGRNWDGAGKIVTGTLHYTGNPAFLQPFQGDYHIAQASAAIDKGVPAGVTTDLDGQARPRGPAPDLGADECYLLDKRLYLPILLRN